MKIRSGFVSNSSSSSFIVKLDEMSARDLAMLLAYDTTNNSVVCDVYGDSWTFNVDAEKGVVEGWTSMDNGDLKEYMERHHIDGSKFTYENY